MQPVNDSQRGVMPPPPPVEQTYIRNRVCDYEDGVAHLHAIIDTLEKRLDIAVAPTVPSPAQVSQVGPPAAGASHMTLRLIQTNEHLGYAIGRLKDIINRIEL